MNNFAISIEFKDKLQELEYEAFNSTIDPIQKIENNKYGVFAKDFGLNHTLINKSIPWPLLNKVVGPYQEDFLERIDEIEDWFKKHVSFCTLSIIPRTTHIDLINQITARGYKLSGYICFWVKSLEVDLKTSEFDKHDIRSTIGYEDDFVKVALKAFQVPNDQKEAFTSFFKEILELETAHNFIALVNGESVGTGSIFLWEEFGFLANGSVLEEHRGKQIQQALIHQRLMIAKSHGVKFAVTTTALDATSGRNMERNGFKLAFVVSNYVLKF